MGIKVGDRVRVDFSKLSDYKSGKPKGYTGVEEGIVRYIRNSISDITHLVEFDNKFSDELHNGNAEQFNLKSGKGWYVPEYSMVKMSSTHDLSLFKFPLGKKIKRSSLVPECEIIGYGYRPKHKSKYWYILRDRRGGKIDPTDMEVIHGEGTGYSGNCYLEIGEAHNLNLTGDLISMDGFTLGETVYYKDACCSGFGKLVGFRENSIINKFIVESDNLKEFVIDILRGTIEHSIPYDKNKIRTFSLKELRKAVPPAAEHSVSEITNIEGFYLNDIVDFKDAHGSGRGRVVALISINRLLVESVSNKFNSNPRPDEILHKVFSYNAEQSRYFVPSELTKVNPVPCNTDPIVDSSESMNNHKPPRIKFMPSIDGIGKITYMYHKMPDFDSRIHITDPIIDDEMFLGRVDPANTPAKNLQEAIDGLERFLSSTVSKVNEDDSIRIIKNKPIESVDVSNGFGLDDLNNNPVILKSPKLVKKLIITDNFL